MPQDTTSTNLAPGLTCDDANLGLAKVAKCTTLHLISCSESESVVSESPWECADGITRFCMVLLPRYHLPGPEGNLNCCDIGRAAGENPLASVSLRRH